MCGLELFFIQKELNFWEEFHSLLNLEWNIWVELEHCRRNEIWEDTLVLPLVRRKTVAMVVVELENVGWDAVQYEQRPQLLGFHWATMFVVGLVFITHRNMHNKNPKNLKKQN